MFAVRVRRVLFGISALLVAACSDAGDGAPEPTPSESSAPADVPVPEVVHPPQIEGMDEELRSFLQTFVEQAEATPEKAEAHGELGLAYEANYMGSEAARCYANAAILQPESARWRYRQAIVQRTGGDLDNALVNMQKAYEKAPEVPIVTIRLGEMLLEAGRLEEAREICLSATEHGATLPESWLGLANVQLEAGEFEQAVASAEKALGIDASYQAAHYTLGQALLALGREEEALQELRQGEGALRRYPKDQFDDRLRDYGVGYGRRMGRIEIMAQSGQPEQAIVELEKILEDRPDDPMVLGLMARTQMTLGQPFKALEYLNHSRRVADPTYQLELDTCSAFYALQDLPRALSHAAQAVELAPAIGRTHFVLGVCKLSSQDMNGAYESLTTAHKCGFMVPELYLQLAQVCGMTQRAQEMQKYAEMAMDLTTDHVQAHLLLVQANLMLGQVAEARAVLDQAKAFAPQDPGVAQAEQAVSQQEGR